jgi:glycosyltransferase involved in cell wall biosynthesis
MQMAWLQGPPKVLDGDDFDYVREWLLLRSSPWYGAKVWNYVNVTKLWLFERHIHRRFAYVVRCSDLDVRRHPAPNVVAIPNGTVVPEQPSREPEARLLFVGELAYEPNRQGVEWFLSSVWPAIRREIPHAQVDIVGKRASDVITRMHGKDGVVVRGFVADLAPLFRAASASIVPLHAGGGTRLKILESLAYGVPVVSTHIGAFGIDAGPESGVERADATDAFAEQCVRRLRAPSEGSARALRGREFVAARYDWRVIQAQVSALALRAVHDRLDTTGPAVSPGLSTPA